MLKSVLCALSLLAALVCLSCAKTDQGNDNRGTSNGQTQMKSPDEAARKGLEALRGLVTQDNFRALGFSSLDEAQKAELGTPIPRKTIGYSQILSSKAGTTLAQLLSNEEEMVYPVNAGGAIKSSIAVTKNQDNWKIRSLGDGGLASILMEAQSASSRPMPTPTMTPTPAASPKEETEPRPSASPANPPAGATQIVSIPGLSLDFVAVGAGERWMLIPTRDYPEVQLTKGRAMAADEAIPLIGNYAREFDKKYGDQIRNRKLSN